MPLSPSHLAAGMQLCAGAAILAMAVLPATAAARAGAPAVAAVAGEPTLLLGGYKLATLGYVAEEFFVAGDSVSYATDTPSDPGGKVTTGAAAPYRTRIVVLRPIDAKRFNGTAVVEWLNVSGGMDAPADWLMAHRELARSGYVYVGVSAQKVGIDGGASLGADMSLKKVNAARYGTLVHPGDAYAYDIFSQAGRVVRGAAPALLHGLKPARVIAVGESQSAAYLTTYINAVDPVARVYDGFLVHSRFGSAAQLGGQSLMAQGDPAQNRPVRFRTDLRKPVLTFITETDLLGGMRLGYHAARQPDTERLRVWEVAGTAHADAYTIQVAFIDDGTVPPAGLARAYAPTKSLMGMELAKPINFAPQHHYVLQAGLSALNDWVATGKAPPHGTPIATRDGPPPTRIADAAGITTGGIRTPWVDVPVAVTLGDGNAGNPFARLFGSSEPFDAARLATLYPGGRADYLARFTRALDRSIAAGFILPADRAEILGLAEAGYPAAG